MSVSSRSVSSVLDFDLSSCGEGSKPVVGKAEGKLKSEGLVRKMTLPGAVEESDSALHVKSGTKASEVFSYADAGGSSSVPDHVRQLMFTLSSKVTGHTKRVRDAVGHFLARCSREIVEEGVDVWGWSVPMVGQFRRELGKYKDLLVAGIFCRREDPVSVMAFDREEERELTFSVHVDPSGDDLHVFGIAQKVFTHGAFKRLRHAIRVTQVASGDAEDFGSLVVTPAVYGEISIVDDAVAINVNREYAMQERFKGNPYVIQVYHKVTYGDEMGIMMEAGALGNLSSWIDKLSTVDAANIVGDIIYALGALADKGVFHRDIKPKNCVLTEVEGMSLGTKRKFKRLKITDFGFARSAVKMATNYRRDFCGTPRYLAPEYIRWQSLIYVVRLMVLGEWDPDPSTWGVVERVGMDMLRREYQLMREEAAVAADAAVAAMGVTDTGCGFCAALKKIFGKEERVVDYVVREPEVRNSFTIDEALALRDRILEVNPSIVANVKGDVWAAGLVILNVLIKREAAFHSMLFLDMLFEGQGLSPTDQCCALYTHPDLQNIIDEELALYKDVPFIGLVRGMLRVDPEERLSADQCKDEYLKILRSLSYEVEEGVHANLCDIVGREL